MVLAAVDVSLPSKANISGALVLTPFFASVGARSRALQPVRMIPTAFSFLVTFAALIGLLAASGASFFAVWASGPVSGASYWADICLSPEVLVFVFFMMSDPQTAPKEQPGRIIYGAATAAVAAGLIAFERTEFGIKVAILASLTVVCALVPMIKAVPGDSKASTWPLPSRLRPHAGLSSGDSCRQAASR